jgi:hypothetical protein
MTEAKLRSFADGLVDFTMKSGAAQKDGKSHMKTAEQNRINMLTTVSGVVTKYQSVWEDHEAYSESVDALAENQAQIDEQKLIVEANSGAADAKELARQTLATAANEVIGAVRAYAVRNEEPELQAKVNYSPSQIASGKASNMVTRCRTVHAAASDVAEELAKYGITPAKLTAFKKKIDAFDSMKTAPRQSRVEKSAAAQLLTQLVRSNARILDEQLDGLMIQFKDSAPGFYNEYFGARMVVASRGSHASGNGNDVETVVPAPVPANA